MYAIIDRIPDKLHHKTNYIVWVLILTKQIIYMSMDFNCIALAN